MSRGEPFAVELSTVSNTAALIVLCRYLASRDKELASYLQDSLTDAEGVGLPPETLATLKMLVKATGG